MKFKVIQGEKGKNKDTQNQNQKNQQQEQDTTSSREKIMEDYYAKERPRSQEMEQAEGDEDIVEAALKHQDVPAGNPRKATGDAA